MYILVLLSFHLRSDFTFKAFKIHTDTHLIKEIIVQSDFAKKNSVYVLLKKFLVNEGLNCIFQSTQVWIWAVYFALDEAVQ